MSRKREEKNSASRFSHICQYPEGNVHKKSRHRGRKDILWRIYKKNRFRELFLVGTDSTPTPFVKIQQPLLF